MAGLIDVGILKPELATSFATGYQQAQQTRQQNEMNQLKLDQLKQDRAMLIDLQTKLRAAGQSDDPNQFFKAMIQTGNPDYMAKGYEGLQRYKELQRAEQLLRKEAPELFGPASGTPAASAAPVNALAPSVAAAPAPANVLAAPAAPATPAAPANALTAPDNRVQELRNKILTYRSLNDPRLKAMADVYQAELNELVKPQVVSPGATVFRGGQAVFTAPAAPTELQRNYDFARSQGFKGSLFDYERQLKEAGRAPVQPVAPTITQIVDPTDPNKMITVDARRYQGGGVGSTGVLGVSGKEPTAALRENKVEAGKTQLQDDLDNLRASFQTLDKLKAVPSTERGALSNLASAAAATRTGQLAGQAFATEAQVERDVINSARSRLVNSIKNATGMSAQQLNSNIELQTMLKSISDPGQSFQSAMRIIDDIEAAYVKGAGLKKKGATAAAPAAMPALPSGFTLDK